MENNQKIYPAEIGFLAGRESFVKAAKALFFNLLPNAGKFLLFGLSASGLLIWQVLLVGVFDRLGVSPKISVIVSSLVYSALFAILAIAGGIKRTVFERNLKTRPICKILIIRRKTREANIDSGK